MIPERKYQKPARLDSAMLELMLTVLPSVAWILYRCFTLLRAPVGLVVESLDLEIPHAPSICIDSVTHRSTVIHWDIEVSEAEELVYMVLVNNKEGMYWLADAFLLY